MKTCINCGLSTGCLYKFMGIICDDWQANVNTKNLIRQAKAIKNKPMNFREKQFVLSCCTAEAFSSSQIHWLNSLIKRFAVASK